MMQPVQVPTNKLLLLLWSLGPPLFVAWRVYLANRMPLMDCDEVYNYWEPLHFMIATTTTQEGRQQGGSGGGSGALGMQTWEYANEYALRTYAYLLPLRGIAQVYQESGLVRHLTKDSRILSSLADFDHDNTVPDSVKLFVLLRATVAAFTALSELLWLWALSRHLSLRVVLLTAVVLLTSAGMNHAAGALLPSSTWMACWCVASACLLLQWHRLFVVVAVTATLATGWPFGVVMLIPLGLRVLYKEFKSTNNDHKKQTTQAGGGMRAVMSLVLFTALVTVVVQTTVLIVDGWYYHDDFSSLWWRQPVSATFNIFKYNALGSGDTMYGVEPLSYYIKNLLLNLNLVAPLGIWALIVYGFSLRVNWDVWTTLSPLIPWILITFPRPHKEERFLFPLYPLLCLSAVMVVDASLNALGRIEAALSRHKNLSQGQRGMLEALVWVPVMALGLSRTAALSKYYTAPLLVYATLSSRLQPHDRVCTCGEWYRFPSSFYLHQEPLGFLPSSFTGQLPQPFSEFGSRPSSQQVLQSFNDQNLMEMDRFSSLDDCDWVVELEKDGEGGGGGDCNVTLPSDRIVLRKPFLNAPQTSSTLHRVLYIPFLHEKARQQGKVVYSDYVLYNLQNMEENHPA